MILHNCKQGEQEWLDIRATCFTASELGPFALDPVKVNLTVDDIKEKIDDEGLNRKGITKRDDLLAVLRDAGFEPEPELCDGAKTAIISKLRQGRRLILKAKDPAMMTAEELIWLERDDEIQAKRDRDFQYNIPVKYGKMLEPFARAYYQSKTGYEVTEVGFIEHDSKGFGCSPDGLVKDHFGWERGIEIKCPIPETHLAWLDAGTLPDEHKLQVHCCMAVTGLQRWDFLSYCPGDAPLLITIERDDFTERLEAGLKTLVIEKAKMRKKMQGLFLAEFEELTNTTK